jgi:hypothetical protein
MSKIIWGHRLISGRYLLMQFHHHHDGRALRYSARYTAVCLINLALFAGKSPDLNTFHSIIECTQVCDIFTFLGLAAVLRFKHRSHSYWS